MAHDRVCLMCTPLFNKQSYLHEMNKPMIILMVWTLIVAIAIVSYEVICSGPGWWG